MLTPPDPNVPTMDLLGQPSRLMHMGISARVQERTSNAHPLGGASNFDWCTRAGTLDLLETLEWRSATVLHGTITKHVTPREPRTSSQDGLELSGKVSASDAMHPGGSPFICRERRAWFPERRGFEILGRTKVLIEYIVPSKQSPDPFTTLDFLSLLMS